MNEENDMSLPMDGLFESLILDAMKESLLTPKLLDPVRWAQMRSAKNSLERLLTLCCGCGEIELRLHPLLCSASLCAEADSLDITDMQALSELMTCANNMAIEPLSDGRLRLSFTFNHVFIRIN